MLYASGWGSNTYSLSIDEQFTNEHYIVHVEPSLLGSVDENYVVAAAATKANMSYILDGENHRLFFIANGVQPTVDIPVIVEFIPKEVKYINFSITGSPYYSSTTFVAMEGMTWGQWVNSPYNTENWYFSNGLLSNNFGGGVILSIQNSDYDSLIAPRVYNAMATDDGCCFIAGTKILMSDNSKKSIEDLKVGESVISYDIDNGENYIAKIAALIINTNSTNMAKLTLDNGIELTMTDYHPIYTLQGWKSITNHMNYDTLTVGDIVKINDGWAGIIAIDQYELENPITTYTLDVIGPNEDPDRDDNTHDNFYANDIVVHNAACLV